MEEQAAELLNTKKEYFWLRLERQLFHNAGIWSCPEATVWARLPETP